VACRVSYTVFPGSACDKLFARSQTMHTRDTTVGDDHEDEPLETILRPPSPIEQLNAPPINNENREKRYSNALVVMRPLLYFTYCEIEEDDSQSLIALNNLLHDGSVGDEVCAKQNSNKGNSGANNNKDDLSSTNNIDNESKAVMSRLDCNNGVKNIIIMVMEKFYILDTRLREEQQETTRLKKRVNDLISKRRALQTRNAGLKDENIHLVQRLEETETQVRELTEEKEDLACKVTELRSELDAERRISRLCASI